MGRLGLREGATRGASYPGPVCTEAQEDEIHTLSFFCNQGQNH